MSVGPGAYAAGIGSAMLPSRSFGSVMDSAGAHVSAPGTRYDVYYAHGHGVQHQQQQLAPYQAYEYNGLAHDVGMGSNVDMILGRSSSLGVNMAGFNWAEVGTNTMDPTGAVEMGLSSESGMDANWITFIRDCGIMDIGGDS